MSRMVDHNNGIAMVFSRTDSKWCQLAMTECSSMLFLGGRVEFIPGLENQHKKGRTGAGTVLFSFGLDCAKALRKLKHRGVYIQRYC